MSYLQSHFTQILTVWGVLWAIASALNVANVFKDGTVGFRIVHFFLAISPGDFVKALKQLGGALVPPMMLLALVALVASTSACSKNTPPPQTANYVAAESVETSAVHALETCGAATAIGDVMARDDWEAVTLDELKSCGADVIQLVKAAWDAHKAEAAALAAVSAIATPADAGADAAPDAGR